MPSLTTAAYGLQVSSSENITFSCAALEEVFHSERPHQKFECQGAGDDDQDETGDGNADTVPGGQGEEEASPSTPSTGALSGGAIAGIVVGALAGLAIVAAVFFFMGKRRRQRSEGTTSVADAGTSSEPKHTHTHTHPQPYQPELQGVSRSELASPVPEFEGSRSPKDTVYYEVDGSAPGGRL